MDYLRGQALASIPALFVVIRLMRTQEEMWSEQALQSRLQLPDASAGGRRDDAEGARGVLAASLEVGVDLGLLRREGDRRSGRYWGTSDAAEAADLDGITASASAFRAHTLRLLCERAVTAVDSGEPPSDLARALTWLMQQDPRRAWPTAWGEGPEAAFGEAGMHDAVGNREQYVALRRWIRALGLGVLTRPETDPKARISLDPTPAVEAALGDLPPADASAWVATLYRRLPVLGAPSLLAALPEGSVVDAGGLSMSVALALVKLERAGRLTLQASDDARHGIAIPLPSPRRIGHITRGSV